MQPLNASSGESGGTSDVVAYAPVDDSIATDCGSSASSRRVTLLDRVSDDYASLPHDVLVEIVKRRDDVVDQLRHDKRLLQQKIRRSTSRIDSLHSDIQSLQDSTSPTQQHLDIVRQNGPSSRGSGSGCKFTPRSIVATACRRNLTTLSANGFGLAAAVKISSSARPQ